MVEPNYEGYNAYLADLNSREMSNSETYDNALLTLSSAFLGLSLTFTDELVPFSKAISLWMLFTSWTLFTLTVVLTISSFIYGQWLIRKLKEGAKPYFLEGKKELNSQSAALSFRMSLFNTFCGISFIAAVVMLTLYVGVNTAKEAVMVEKTVEVPEKRGQPVSAYEHAPQKPPEQQPQQKPDQDSSKK